MVLPESSEAVLHRLPDLVHGRVVFAASELPVLPPALVQVLHLRGDHPRALGLLQRWKRVTINMAADQLLNDQHA